MNVKDVQEHLNFSTGDRFELMIAQQKKLMEKYHHIEAQYRLTNDNPVDLDDSRGQLLIKDFAWRTTEEVAEALSALQEEQCPASDRLLHAQEEVADALHFLLELAILSGADMEEFMPFTYKVPGDKLDQLFFHNTPDKGNTHETLDFIRQLGMVCHTLKNKPWKQTQMLTDRHEFYRRLYCTLIQFCRMSESFGMGPEELFQMYFRKAQVNEFRQRSQY